MTCTNIRWILFGTACVYALWKVGVHTQWSTHIYEYVYKYILKYCKKLSVGDGNNVENLKEIFAMNTVEDRFINTSNT